MPTLTGEDLREYERSGPPELQGFEPPRSCPTLLSYERTCLISYMRSTPEQRRVTLEQYSKDPKTSGNLLIAMQWLFTS